MIVGTTQAAKILNISSSRLRILLIQGRVEGAYKTGRMWLIPCLGARSWLNRTMPLRVDRARGRTAI